MKTKPDYTEYNDTVGGEVRYYEESGKWRYVCACGEGVDLPSLEAAQEQVKDCISWKD